MIKKNDKAQVVRIDDTSKTGFYFIYSKEGEKLGALRDREAAEFLKEHYYEKKPIN